MKYRNIDRNFRSTVTVAYRYITYNIYIVYIQRKCPVEVTSVGLAHARPIKYNIIIIIHVIAERGEEGRECALVGGFSLSIHVGPGHPHFTLSAMH